MGKEENDGDADGLAVAEPVAVEPAGLVDASGGVGLAVAVAAADVGQGAGVAVTDAGAGVGAAVEGTG